MAQKLEKTQRLMDNFDVAVEASRRLSRGTPERKPPPERITATRSPSTSQRQLSTTRNEQILEADSLPLPLPGDINLPFVQLPGLPPYVLLRPEYYLQDDQDDAMSYRPPTPTPSLVSHSSFDAREQLELQVPFQDDSASEASPSNLGVSLRHRNPSEGEMSVASDNSAAPDWMDEAVVAGLCPFLSS